MSLNISSQCLSWLIQIFKEENVGDRDREEKHLAVNVPKIFCLGNDRGSCWQYLLWYGTGWMADSSGTYCFVWTVTALPSNSNNKCGHELKPVLATSPFLLSFWVAESRLCSWTIWFFHLAPAQGLASSTCALLIDSSLLFLAYAEGKVHSQNVLFPLHNNLQPTFLLHLLPPPSVCTPLKLPPC